MTAYVFRVMLCCNGPDNGLFRGAIDGLNVLGARGADPLIAVTGRDVKFDPDAGRIGRLRGLAFGDFHYGYGNWCWNLTTLPRGDLARVLGYLHAAGWHMESGQYGAADAWADGTIAEKVANPRRRATT